jgi:prevent-host-death family protein
MYMKPRRYSIARARAELPGLVRAVERGASVEITRRGEPVAVMLSPSERDRLVAARRTFSEAYDAFLSRHAADLPIVGRRYFDATRDRSPGRKVRL